MADVQAADGIVEVMKETKAARQKTVQARELFLTNTQQSTEQLVLSVAAPSDKQRSS